METDPLQQVTVSNQAHKMNVLGDSNQHRDQCGLKDLTTVLMEAASTGNIALMENMLLRGLDLNAVAEDGNTAMHCAAKTGQVAMLQHILAKGAAVDPSNATMKGRRPIHEAITGNHSGATLVLLHAGADLLKPDLMEKTVLDHISLSGSMEITQALFLEERRQISALDMALHLVASYARLGKCSILRWLLARFPMALPQLNILSQSPIYLAVISGSLETLQILLLYYTDGKHSEALAKTTSHSLRCAARRDDEKMVELLLQHDAVDVNEGGGKSRLTALHHTVKIGNTKLVDTILGHRNIDVNSRSYLGCTPLHIAAETGHIDVIQRILSHKEVDIQQEDKYGLSALCFAFSACRWTALTALLKHQNITTCLKTEFTEGEWPVTKLYQLDLLMGYLIDRDLFPTTGRSWGRLIKKTVMADEVELMRLLFTRLDIDVNSCFEPAWDRRNALQLAAKSHCHDIFVLYLDHPQIDVNSQTNYGESALHSAVLHNCMRAVELLLARPEIDLTSRDLFDRTALDCAREYGRREMSELLLQHGASGKSTEWNTSIVETTFDARSCRNFKRRVAALHINTEADHFNKKYTADTPSEDKSEDEDMSIDGDSE
jgi:ankyrin repeat protein